LTQPCTGQIDFLVPYRPLDFRQRLLLEAHAAQERVNARLRVGWLAAADAQQPNVRRYHVEIGRRAELVVHLLGLDQELPERVHRR
jgi:hypothetical protein